MKKIDYNLDDFVGLDWAKDGISRVVWVLNSTYQKHGFFYNKSTQYQKQIPLGQSYDFWKSVEFVLSNLLDRKNRLGRLYIESMLENSVIFDVSLTLDNNGHLNPRFIPVKSLIGEMWFGFIFDFLAKGRIDHIGICEYCNYWFHKRRVDHRFCITSHRQLCYKVKNGFTKQNMKKYKARPVFYGEMDVQKQAQEVKDELSKALPFE